MKEAGVTLGHGGRFRVLATIVALLATTTLVFSDRGAQADPGQLTPVTDFGPNPGELLMFEWVPEDLQPNAPIVVVLHGCFASAALYDDETGWTTLAQRWNVALVFPEQTAANDPTKCFQFWNPDDVERDGGEAASIRQMVASMQTRYGTDPDRVFIMGHSGGGLFTSVMLATYPDVFKAGAIVAGGPYRCGDEGALVVGIDGNKSPVRGGKCVDGSVDKTAQEWGDLARSGNPGYTGPKPRVSIWHGTGDTMVSPKNLTELVEQWTNFHTIDQAAEVDELVNNYPHRVYENGEGTALVESYELTGQSHGWPYDPGTADHQCNGAPPSWNAKICAAYYAGHWFGLDRPASVPDGDGDGIDDGIDNCADVANSDQRDTDGDNVGDACDPETTVDIDVKPGEGSPPTMRPKSGGRVPVAILSSATYDAVARTNLSSLTFGKTGTEQSLSTNQGRPQCGLVDANGDGLTDVVCQFDNAKLGFTGTEGDTTAVLWGRTSDPTPIPIRGEDAVRVTT